MRKRIIFISLAIVMFMSVFGFAACDSTSGRSNKVSLLDYRSDGWFELPVKVSKASAPPDSVRHFKSKMSMTEIYDNLCAADSLQAEYFESYILIKDLSAENLGYCIIYPKAVKKFNYIATNMACHFHKSDTDTSIKEILTPMHLIPELMEDNTVIENKEYGFDSTKEALISFYAEYGFDIIPSQDGITLKDTIGRSGRTNFDDTINDFEIVLHDSKISFKNLRSGN